jgi:hypothetical protein
LATPLALVERCFNKNPRLETAVGFLSPCAGAATNQKNRMVGFVDEWIKWKNALERKSNNPIIQQSNYPPEKDEQNHDRIR